MNRGGDNRDDPRRILEDSVDCVWGGWEGRDESSAQAQRDGGGGGFGALVVFVLNWVSIVVATSHTPNQDSKSHDHCYC